MNKVSVFIKNMRLIRNPLLKNHYYQNAFEQDNHQIAKKSFEQLFFFKCKTEEAFWVSYQEIFFLLHTGTVKYPSNNEAFVIVNRITSKTDFILAKTELNEALVNESPHLYMVLIEWDSKHTPQLPICLCS